ncbi:hypothetical protein IP70_15795 [alpha proteobacterium AAP38]|nr:hypothetical protein IP70_15795 [alpha proteobacterium AAP38]
MDSDLLPQATDNSLPPKQRVLLDIAAERTLQDAKWGGPSHDDTHIDGELALAGATYAMSGWGNQPGDPRESPVRTARISDVDAAYALTRRHSPCSHNETNLSARQLLVRAAACIVAEIERLDRQTQRMAP